MRVFASFVCSVTLATLSFSQDGNEGNGPNKDVEVKVTFPKVAEFKATDKAGGEVGKITVKVEVTNKSNKGIPLSSANYDVKFPKLRGSVQKSIDAFLLDAGKTAKQDRTIKFNTVLPKDGEAVVVELYVYGHKKVGTLKAKVSD